MLRECELLFDNSTMARQLSQAADIAPERELAEALALLDTLLGELTSSIAGELNS